MIRQEDARQSYKSNSHDNSYIEVTCDELSDIGSDEGMDHQNDDEHLGLLKQHKNLHEIDEKSLGLLNGTK